MHLGADSRRVDVSDSGVQVAHGGECLVHVLVIESGRQSVLNAVGDSDRVFQIFAGDDGHDRSENFLLRDAHLGVDIDKYGRLHEVAMLVFALVEAVAAAFHLRTFGFANFYVVEVGLELGFVDGRAHLGTLIQAVANFQTLSAIHVALHEFGVHDFLHDDAAGGGAALAGGPEAAPEAAFDGKVEVGVVEHNHRIFPAELQGAMFETLGRSGADNASNRGGTSQRDGADVGMLHQRPAHLGTESADDVDHALGDPGIGERANQVVSGERRILGGLDHAGVAANDGGK